MTSTVTPHCQCNSCKPIASGDTFGDAVVHFLELLAVEHPSEEVLVQRIQLDVLRLFQDRKRRELGVSQ